MNSLKSCLTSVTLFAALPACGSDAADSTTKHLGPEEAPALAEVALAGESVRGAILDDGILPDPVVDSGRIRWYLPRPVHTLLTELDVAAVPRETQCFTESGGWVDADEDGVPVDYSVTFGCHDALAAAYSVDILGKVSVDDADDNDAKSGYHVEWAGFSIERTFIRTPGRTLILALDGWATLERSEAGFGLAEDYTNKALVNTDGEIKWGKLHQGQIIKYTPDDTEEPFAAGVLAYLGETTFEHAGGKLRLGVGTDPTLHFQNSCRIEHPGRPGWDAGAVVFKDGATLRVEYSGCDEVSATLDGVLIEL